MSSTRYGNVRARVAVVGVLIAALAVTLAGPNASADGSASRTVSKARVHKVKVGHSFFGVHDRYLSSLRRASTGSIRIWDAGTDWATIEPTEGTWNWAPLDAVVKAAHNNGTAVTLVLGLSPWYAASTPTDAPDPTMYRDYVQAVMERYRAGHWGYRGIQSYQVWNEANISTFWTGTDDELAEMTRTVHSVRDAVDPGVRVIGPAMVTRLRFEQKAARAFYSTKLHSTGQPVWKYVDAVSLNLYPTETVATSNGGQRPSIPEDAMALLHTMRGFLDDANVPRSKPIWDTEINYGMGRDATDVPISGARQTANVIRTYLLNAAQGVKQVDWYAYDMGTLPGGGTLGNTLLTDPRHRAAGTLTRAGKAFTMVQKWMNGTMIGTTTQRPCIKNRQGTYTCKIKYATRVGRIYWNPFKTVKVRLVSTATRKTNENGVTSRVTGGSRIKVNFKPVLVKSKR
ncbi:MAG TPA: hypothetical protein VGK78_05590 [Nocardioides sp.]